ncbi:hypothetical protein BC832DRAFT_572782 [Gaertneriomyces semiglobifer]|nr:hypothetical protein BC832DRAFT_572782 [Gaertneriomyces semiglobifer]
MTSQLPPNLQKLFIPRPPLKYLPPVDKDLVDRKGPRLSGLAEFLERCQGHDLDYVPTPTLAEVRKRKKEEREKKAKQAIEDGTTKWDPNSDEHIHSDPYKTLFIGRLSYESTEKDLLKAFEAFGPIKTLRIVTTPEGKSRGYAFIEYEREKDMKAAYKEADGMKINDRRVLVDVERGRTVKGWKPRRLGGGLGGTRIGGPDVNVRHSGREGAYGAAMGGPGRFDDRGGYGGSFRGGYGGPPRGGYGGPPRRGGFGGGYGGRGGGGYGGGGGGGGFGDRPPYGMDSRRGGYERDGGRGGYDRGGDRGRSDRDRDYDRPRREYDRDGGDRVKREEPDDRRGSHGDRDREKDRRRGSRDDRHRSRSRSRSRFVSVTRYGHV